MTLKKVGDGLPPVVEGIQAVSGEISPVLERVDVITEILPSVVQEVANIRVEMEKIRESLPVLLTEAAYREAIPSVVSEVENIREMIPPILERVESIQAQIPDILAEVEAVRGEVPAIVEQVEGIQTQIPAILAEVEAVRIAIPDYIEDANELTDDIRIAGKEAAEGAAQGFFTGIIKAPVNMVSGIGSNVFGRVQITDEIRAQFRDGLAQLLATPERGEIVSWEDAGSELRFEVAITRLNGDLGNRTARIEARAFSGEKELESAQLEAKETSDGSWDTELR
jgi:archaellum component FlaC|tara:strand:- start:758 stop:1603 length:846 start_codon:yes stop_codon:yes gene_type:complete